MDAHRSVLHVDMDAFYVSVELLRRPELRGLPVVVGGRGPRSVVAAASYEARRYGIHSAMPSTRARALCADAVFLPPDMAHYLEVSARLHAIFSGFTPLVEQISVDEAFLDVSGARSLLGPAEEIAWSLRSAVAEREGLGCSVGLAPNKFLAKLASEHAKPRAGAAGVEPGHGVFVVPPGAENDFLFPMGIESLWGVGPVTAARLSDLGVRTVGDLRGFDEASLRSILGEANGRHLHRLARGIDDREVTPGRAAKSIGNEETFAVDIRTEAEMHDQVVRLCDSVSRRLRSAGLAAGTVMLKVRFASFATVTRSVSASVPVSSGPAMVAALAPALAAVDPSPGVRLVGVHAQRLVPAGSPPERLFADEADEVEMLEREWLPASRAVDEIVERFGTGSIGPASLLGDEHRRGDNPFGPD